MLAARRGLGTDESRHADRTFVEAVRWALYVERVTPYLEQLRTIAATDPPERKDPRGVSVPVLTGLAAVEFRERRVNARRQLAELEESLFPEDLE